MIIHNVGFCIKKKRKSPLHACKYFSFECAVVENQYNAISISFVKKISTGFFTFNGFYPCVDMVKTANLLMIWFMTKLDKINK